MKLHSRTHRSCPPTVLFTLLGAGALVAQVPTYEVRPVAAFTVTTTLRGASPAGHLVGDQIVLGLSQPFVATAADGLTLLPLPSGYQAGFAMDANAAGVVVGAVSTGGFPFDGGEPAIWTPNGVGGWSVTIPQQFATLPSPLGNLSIQGGVAVAVNENGVIVGWSRYQGFQGGPTTRFFLTGAPQNLGALGFAATVTDLSDTTDLIVGGGLRMDLNTGAVTNLGLPPSSPSGTFSAVLGYAVNDAGRTIAAARLATSLPDKYLTYRHDDASGWTRHNPAVVPSVFPGFYDVNGRGDVSAAGGVWFEAEGVLVGGFDQLLEPQSAHWDTALGFLADDRRVFTTAVDTTTGQHSLVVLVPHTCQADLGFQGPGTATATLCGAGLGAGGSSDYVLAGAPPSTIGALSFSLAGFPNVPLFGGTAVSLTATVLWTVTTDPVGGATIPIPGLPGPALDAVLQTLLFDASQPAGFALTNAIAARFGV